MGRIVIFFSIAAFLQSCLMSEKNDTGKRWEEVNVYTHRHYDVDKEIFKKFENETGIDVNVIDDDADKLLVRLEKEGKNSPCDVFMTVDAGRLEKAKDAGVLQKIDDESLLKTVSPLLRDKDGFWLAQTIRARVIAYSKDRVDTNVLSTYEDLANPKWKGKLLSRGSDNIYNQSLLAALISNLGESKALVWTKGVVANFARNPQGNDKDQVKAIAAGEGDIALVNTYYYGKMIESEDPAERDAVSKVALFYPNQNSNGAHINISGAGIAKYSKNKKNAIKFLAFLMRNDIQEMFAAANNEFPAKKGVKIKPILKNWAKYKCDTLALQKLGGLNSKALKMLNEAGWK